MKRAIRVRFKSHVLPPLSTAVLLPTYQSSRQKNYFVSNWASILYRGPPPTHSSTYVFRVRLFFSDSLARVFLLWQVRNIFTLFTKIKTIPQYFLTAAAASEPAPVFPSSTSVFFAAAAARQRRPPPSWGLGIVAWIFRKTFPQLIFGPCRGSAPFRPLSRVAWITVSRHSKSEFESNKLGFSLKCRGIETQQLQDSNEWQQQQQ